MNDLNEIKEVVEKIKACVCSCCENENIKFYLLLILMSEEKKSHPETKWEDFCEKLKGSFLKNHF